MAGWVPYGWTGASVPESDPGNCIFANGLSFRWAVFCNASVVTMGNCELDKPPQLDSCPRDCGSGKGKGQAPTPILESRLTRDVLDRLYDGLRLLKIWGLQLGDADIRIYLR